MASHKVVPYSFKVKNKNNEKYYKLDAIGRGNEGIKQILQDFFQEYDNELYDDESSEKTIRFSNISTFDQRLDAKIKSGQYGVKSEIRDKDNPQNLKAQRDEEDTEEIELYCLYTPTQNWSHTSLIMFHKFKNFGAKTLFQKSFESFLKENHYDIYEVEMNAVVSTELLDKIERSDRNFELRLIKYRESNSAASSLYGNDHVSHEERIKPLEDGGNLELLGDKLQSLMNRDNTRGLEIDDEEYDELKFTIKNDGSQETLSIDSFGRGSFRMSKNLVEGDEIQSDVVRPNKDNLRDAALSLIDSVEESIDDVPEDKKANAN